MLEGLEGLSSALADRYRIDVGPDGQPEILGHGGMATVFLAHDLRHQRQVAIKVLHQELSAILGADRFITEIRVTAKLQHPHIVPLLDSGIVPAGAAGRPQARPYYVMPHVVGETLAERLVREKPLPVSEALRIVEQVASALDYAHANGIIHRDIKPSNILLSGGFALVVDFGLARAIDQSAEGAASTVSGVAVGTPYYMSPEQARGDTELDGRSDTYSLGCVLYEMLAGTPPFTDLSPYKLLARHRAASVPSLRAVRPDLPRSIEQAVATALAKEPSDRFSTAGEFVAALTSGRVRVRVSRRVVLAAGAVALGAGVLWLVTRGPFRVVASGGDALDSLRYFVVPSEDANASALLQEGLERWTGISVVQRFQVDEALARRGGALPDAEGSRALARTLGAGRFVRVRVSPTGERSRVDAVLYESGRGTVVREASVMLGTHATDLDSAYGALADRLLLGVGELGPAGDTMTGSRSLPARQMFREGQAALAEWDLARADSKFVSAQRLDPEYAAASLWLAQVRVWSRAPPGAWRSEIERAAAARAQLSPGDRDRADAMLTLSRGDIPRACSLWEGITKRTPADFAAWYSLATCLVRDSVVVRDISTRSGWRFRSSYAAAVRAYQRAFELLPTIQHAYRGESYEDLQRLLMTSRTDLAMGWAAPPDTSWFLAYLSWEGDSLTLMPFPALQVVSQTAPVSPVAMREAEVRQRNMLRDIAANWVKAYPASADALEALAGALDLIGDPSSVDTLRRARLLATDQGERKRIAVSELWLRLKLSLPADSGGVAGVRALADTLLTDMSHTEREALRLSGVAALTGRARRALDLIERSAQVSSAGLPLHLNRAVRSLLVMASLGGPVDSLLASDRLVARGVEESLSQMQRGPLGLDWARATTLAYPDLALLGLRLLKGKGSSLLDAQADAASGNLEPARRLIGELKRQRTAISPADLGVDALYPEARLLLAIGDTSGAAAWLDPTLTALHRVRPTALSFLGRPGALVRAMALRSDLADRLGDPEAARRWARAVVILWSDADPFLQPIVRRMSRLAN